ncbi:aldo-keto reductase AKR2E4-like [Zerene cesonia]|uniref:aldo-keto reductase AKR2E4-like n=1 Tax=Zerene cesonia TaxID=33412 RepID=UPI0018E573A5|nr:aldo-keto reductase AKR2E4-like [Zerene cesonia]
MVFFVVLIGFLSMGATSDVVKIKLNNGDEMPVIALGTYLGFNENGIVQSRDHFLRNVILNAIDEGYRHFDTASIYETEGEIGEAVVMKIDEGVVKRSDVFITTKLWNTNHERDSVTMALRKTLLKMGLDYVDLFLMHWPIALNEDYTYSDVDYLDTWRGMEDAQRLGLTRSIGVSNFNKEQIERLLQECSIRPVALQIEVHPQIVQQDLVEYAQNKGLVVMGYSPFGSLVKRHGLEMSGPKMDDPTLMDIAKKYSKTTPQVVLRWLVDRNIVPVAKTVNSTRIKENINIFDFKLTEEEIFKINNFNEFKRYTLPSFWQNHKYYPFEKVANPLPNPFVKK